MKTTCYSTNAGTDLGHKPPTMLGKRVPGTYVREEFFAKVIVLMTQQGMVLSQKPKTIMLPQAEILREQSIDEAALALVKKSTRNNGLLELRGKFNQSGQPPTYVLRYVLSKDAPLEPGQNWLAVEESKVSSPDFPLELLRLLVLVRPDQELGYDLDGQLCIWTEEVEDRVLRKNAIDKIDRILNHQKLPAEVRERIAA